MLRTALRGPGTVPWTGVATADTLFRSGSAVMSQEYFLQAVSTSPLAYEVAGDPLGH